MPALDNGIMPVERWKEACEAASCHANYRKSKGLTETCDDYFVDGVQWADEHPIKVKEMDYRPMDKDFERDAVSFCIDNGLNTTPYIAKTIAKHFFKLGVKVKKGGKL